MQNNQTKFKETEVGLIPEDWEVLELNEVCRTISDTYDLKDKDEIIFLNTSDVYDGKVLNHSPISAKGLPGQAKKKIQKGDILYSEIRPANKRYAFIDFNAEEFVVSTKLMVLRSENKVDSKFLLIFLSSPEILNQFQILAESRSGTFPQITFDAVKHTAIPFPPINEQQKIAEVLGTLDAKIELNRKMNKTLEQISGALFTRWLTLPEGQWRPSPLASVFDFLEGPGIRNWQYSDTGTRFINIRLINDGNIDIQSANFINQEDVDSKYQHFLLQENDMVVSTSGSLGRSAIVRRAHLPMLLNTSVIRFRPKDGKSYPFMYQYLKSDIFLDQQLSLASGSAQVNFGPIHLNQMEVLLPNQEMLDIINNTLQPVYDQMKNNLDEIKTLSQIRDSLLPRLMSGKLRVK